MKQTINKRILAGILACVMVFSGLLAGFPFLNDMVFAGDDLQESEITTYDLANLTSQDSLTITEHSDAIGNRWGQYLGQAANENFSITMKVDTGDATGNYLLGLCKEQSSNITDGAGYYLEIDEAGVIRLNIGNTYASGGGWSVPEKPYMLECGVVNLVDDSDVVQAKRIFLKINGNEVFAYEDTSMTITCGALVNVYANTCPLTLTTTKKQAEVTEYDFVDLAGKDSLAITEHSATNGNEWGQFLGQTETSNFSVKMKVDTGNTTGKYYLGLCKTQTVNLWDGAGYYFAIDEADGGSIQFHKGHDYKGNKGGVIPNEKPYVLEYGVVDVIVGTGSVQAKKVFLKINGTEVFAYEDTEMSGTCGTMVNVYTDKYPFALTTTKIQAAINEYDLMDLTSTTSVTIQEHSAANDNENGQSLAKGPGENFSVKMKVDTGNATSGAYQFGLCKGTGKDLWDSQGYILVVDLGGAIRLEYKDGWLLHKPMTIPTKEIYTLEYGIVNIIGETDVVVARKIFVNINGQEVFSYIDDKMQIICGEYFSVYTQVLPLTLSTTKNVQPEVLTDAAATVYDYYDLTGETQKLYQQPSNGFPLGAEHDSRKENFGVKVLVDSGEVTSGAYMFGLCKNASDNMWDTYGYNIRIDLSGFIALERGSDGQWIGFKSVNIPNSYLLEYGIVNVYNSADKLIGKKIYAKIDGNEVFSYLDSEMEQKIGNRTTFVTEIPVTLSNTLGKKPEVLIENVKSVYDFYHVTSEISLSYKNTGNGVSLGDGSDALMGNFGVRMQVDTGEAKEGSYIFGISKNDGTNMWDTYGYLIRIDLAGSITLERGSDYQWLSHQTAKIPSSYILEYGIVDMWTSDNVLRGKKIYVKIDGVEVFSYLDKEMGQKVGNKATFFSNVPITLTNTIGLKPEVLTPKEAVVYDFYDLTSQSSMSIYKGTGQNQYGFRIGNGDEKQSGNFAIKMKVDTQGATSGEYLFGLCKSDAYNMWDGYGYKIRINMNGSIVLKRGSDLQVLDGVNTNIPSSYELEYGIVDVYNARNELRGKKIYVKINGVEVLSCIDKKFTENMGNEISAFSDTPIKIGTCYPVVTLPVTYVVNGKESKTCEYIDLATEVVLGKDTNISVTKDVDFNKDVKIKGVYLNDKLMTGTTVNQRTSMYLITNPKKTDKLKVEVKIRTLTTDEAHVLDLYDVSGKTEVLVPADRNEHGIGTLAVDKQIYGVNSALRFTLQFPDDGANVRIVYGSDDNILWCSGIMFDIGNGGYLIKIANFEYPLVSGSTELFGTGKKPVIEIGMVKCYADDVYTYDRLYIKAGKTVNDMQLLGWYDTTQIGSYGTGIIAMGPDPIPGADQEFRLLTTKNIKTIQDVSASSEKEKLATYVDAFDQKQYAVYYPKTVVAGKSANIAIYAKEGTRLAALKIGGKTVDSTLTSDGGYLYKIDNVTSNVTFSYEIEPDDSIYKVSATKAKNLKILIAKESVAAGGSTEIQIKVDKGYVLKNILINGADYTNFFQYDKEKAAYVAMLTGIRENKEIEATAAKDEQVRPIASAIVSSDKTVISDTVKIVLIITGASAVLGVLIAVIIVKIRKRKKGRYVEEE